MKYKLLKDTGIPYGDETIYRIQALKDFAYVHTGDIGGYVASEDNLSQNGNAWIYDDAKAIENSRVSDNAKLEDKAILKGHAKAMDNSTVANLATASGHAELHGNSWLGSHTTLSKNAKLFDSTFVGDFASITGNVTCHDKSFICGDAMLSGNVIVKDNATVKGNSMIYENVTLSDQAFVKDATIVGNENPDNPLIISSSDDYFVFRDPVSSPPDYLVYTRPNKQWKSTNFHGTAEDLEAYASTISQKYATFCKATIACMQEIEKLL